MTTKESKELKTQIRQEQDAIVEKILAAKTEEEKQALSKTIGESKARIAELQGRLKELKRNPTGSSYFEFQPHIGMNRQQAKAFRKQRKHDLNKRSSRNVNSSARLDD